MSLDSHLIEQIIVTAVEKLMAGSSSARADLETDRVDSSSKETAISQEDKQTAPTNAVEVFIPDAVITAEALQGCVNGKSQFLIGRRSILTPSAHDFIRAHGLSWSREVSQAAHQNHGQWSAIVVKTCDQAVGCLREDFSDWSQDLLGDAGEAARRAVGILCRGESQGVVLFVDQVHLVTCLTNRHSQIRAVAVDDADSVAKATRDLGANLLVIDPSGKSRFQLRGMLRSFTQAGAPKLPANWEALNRGY